MDFDTLYQVIKHNKVQLFDEYLSGGGDPNLASEKGGWTLLMTAAFKGQGKMVSKLLDHGARVNDVNKFGESALTFAAGKGYLRIVETLLAAGATVETPPGACSVLQHMAACGCKSEKIKKLLRERGAV